MDQVSRIPPSMWPSRKNSWYAPQCIHAPLISCNAFSEDTLVFNHWWWEVYSICTFLVDSHLHYSGFWLNTRLPVPDHMKAMLNLFQREWKLPAFRNGAVLYIGVLLFAVGFRRFIIEFHDPYKCRALMTKGQWHHDMWLTLGCVTESYGSRSVTDCLLRRKIIFVGDAQIQMLYWALTQKFDRDVRPEHRPLQNLHWSSDNIEIQSIWDPHLNGSELYQALDAYREQTSDAPALLIVGLSNWYAENNKIESFAATVEHVASASRPATGRRRTGLESFTEGDGPGDLLLFAPVQEPYHDTSTTNFELTTQTLNARLSTIANEHGINVLSSFNQMTAGRKDKYLNDEWSPQWEVLQKRVDLLLGLRCNAKLAERGHFPNTRVCCANWRHRNYIQSGFLMFGLGVLPALVLLDHAFSIFSSDGRTVLRALSAFSAIISLQYVTDRTHVFEQVRRFPLFVPNLKGMLAFAFIIGVVTVRRSAPPKGPAQGDKEKRSHIFLPRDQSDEWKGWLQVLIILYHYNSAWTADWYWEIIRMAVASYLFLTGFGHTVYFLQKGDYSFRRVCAVMIRTNLLPSTLAYVMRTRWLLYYYMPLSTFWFLMVYATMAIASKRNGSKLFVVGKIIASAAAVRVFINTRDLPETVTRLFAITCKMSFDANAFFHYRIKIDLYIVYIGMLVAVIYVSLGDTLRSESRQGLTARCLRQFFPGLKYITIAIALVSFPGFFYMVQKRIHSQSEWTSWQPYITFIPILSFLVLRNAHPTLRNFHSVAFAWLGRYSGEMYVMQDHLWLAGDQEAVLRTGIFHGDETVSRDRWRDLLLLTPLYLIACCIIGDATATITTSFVKPPSQNKVNHAGTTRATDEVEMSLLPNVENQNGSLMNEKKRSKLNVLNCIQQFRPWPRKVSHRAIFILALMWLLNVTYT